MFWQLLPCFGNFEQFLPCFGSRGNFWQIRITGKGLAWKQLGTQCSVGVMPRWDEPCDHLMPPPSLPVTLYSGQNHKIRISVWGQSILVNDLLYLRLFSHLDITPSKYETVNSTSFLAQTWAGHLGSCITCWYMVPSVFGQFHAWLGVL